MDIGKRMMEKWGWAKAERHEILFASICPWLPWIHRMMLWVGSTCCHLQGQGLGKDNKGMTSCLVGKLGTGAHERNMICKVIRRICIPNLFLMISFQGMRCWSSLLFIELVRWGKHKHLHSGKESTCSFDAMIFAWRYTAPAASFVQYI